LDNINKHDEDFKGKLELEMAKNLSPEDKKLLRENKALSDSIANGGKTSTGTADPLTH